MNQRRIECNWKSVNGRESRGVRLWQSKAHAFVLVLMCSVFVAGNFPTSTITLSPAYAAQRTESENEMAAAKFPRLVAEYLQDLHSRHPTLAAAISFSDSVL
jgi:hypothetical protein